MGLQYQRRETKEEEATKNVRTLLDLKVAERRQRQTALIARELDRYSIDIAALQETRLEGQGSLQGNNYSFFLDRERAGIRREAGVLINYQLLRGIAMLTGFKRHFYYKCIFLML